MLASFLGTFTQIGTYFAIIYGLFMLWAVYHVVVYGMDHGIDVMIGKAYWWREVLTPRRLLGDIAEANIWYDMNQPIGTTMRAALAHIGYPAVLDMTVQPRRNYSAVQSAWKWWLRLRRIEKIPARDYSWLILHWSSAQQRFVAWAFSDSRMTHESRNKGTLWSDTLEDGDIVFSIDLRKSRVCAYTVWDRTRRHMCVIGETGDLVCYGVGNLGHADQFAFTGTYKPFTGEQQKFWYHARITLTAFAEMLAKDNPVRVQREGEHAA